jgi:hypothetical protein
VASTAGRKRAEAKEEAEQGHRIAMEVDGTQYVIAAKDLTALDVRAMRDQLGYTYNGLVKRATQDMDVDIVAAIVWLSRRIYGEPDLDYDAVAAVMTYETTYSFVDPKDVTPPEA